MPAYAQPIVGVRGETQVRQSHAFEASLPIMSLHIAAGPGDIAPVVLMPGDPLRARWIAETMLDDARCYTEIRGMYGFTGTWRGQRVSVQGSGMGQPSLAIYAHELFAEYDVASIIRIGSCGSMTQRVNLGDVVIASGACTDSGMNRLRFEGFDYAPVADFGLLRAAHAAAQHVHTPYATHVGLILSTDAFYAPRPELVSRLADYQVLAVEMEASALYTLAAQHGRRALAVCTVSDHLLTNEKMSALEREQSFTPMVEIALGAALSQH